MTKREHSSVVIFDFETTGLNPILDHPTEIAMKVIDWRAEPREYSSMIKLPEGVEIPELITDLTGLTTKKVNSEGEDKAFVKAMIQSFTDETTLWVAHNANFDLGFLYHHFGIEPAHFVCTRTVEILTAPHLNAGLQESYDRYFPEKKVTQTHRALDDVEMTSQLFNSQTGTHRENIYFFYNKVVNMPDRELRFTPHNAIVLDFAQKYDSVRTTDKLRKRIADMEEDVEFLACLESAGVDNWSGYDYAREMMEEEN
jgi:DNA polymerase III subunit epsilon